MPNASCAPPSSPPGFDRPISEIGPLDVLEIINAKKRRAPQMARALMVLIRRFFNWACDAHVYGLTASPCDRLSVSRIIGAVPKRNRRLNDDEVFAFWRATGKMGYPAGAAYKMLLLTGLRLNECAALSWPELSGDLITIPASRMKAKDATATEHLVPITVAMQEIIASLPRHRGGQYLFSLSGGKRPLAMTGAIKADLDRRMERTLRALARRHGEDHRTGHAAALDQSRSEKNGALWAVGASRRVQRRRDDPCAPTARRRRHLRRSRISR